MSFVFQWFCIPLADSSQFPPTFWSILLKYQCPIGQIVMDDWFHQLSAALVGEKWHDKASNESSPLTTDITKLIVLTFSPHGAAQHCPDIPHVIYIGQRSAVITFGQHCMLVYSSIFVWNDELLRGIIDWFFWNFLNKFCIVIF